MDWPYILMPICRSSHHSLQFGRLQIGGGRKEPRRREEDPLAYTWVVYKDSPEEKGGEDGGGLSVIMKH